MTSHAPSRFSRMAGWSSPAEAPTPSRSPGFVRAVRSMGRSASAVRSRRTSAGPPRRTHWWCSRTESWSRRAGRANGPGGRVVAGAFARGRYNRDGTLDGTFGAGGATTTDFGGDDVATGLLLTPAGDVVAVGSTTAGTGGSFALAQYTAAGILDAAFGTGGTLTTKFSSARGPADSRR